MDGRVELSDLATGGSDGLRVLDQLDRHRIVIRSAAGRNTQRGDQAALANAVNLAAREFANVELDVPDAPNLLAPFVPGERLPDALAFLAATSPAVAARQPDTDLELVWGAEPAGAGVCADASAWTYTFGQRHTPLLDTGRARGPHHSAVMATSFAVAQLFGHALSPLGVPFYRVESFVANLLDYAQHPAPAPDCAVHIPSSVLAGAGSVGTSLVYAALLADIPGGLLDAVDPDAYSDRNPLRYPILFGPRGGTKVAHLEELAAAGALNLRAHPESVRNWLASHPDPPVINLLMSSVDTIEARLEATDVLAATTLNVGVAGLELHIARHAFGGPDACSFCQYCDQAPALSASALIAQALGVPVELIIAVRHRDGRLADAEAQQITAAGRVPGGAHAGDRLEDVHRRIYAQATVPLEHGPTQVSAPHVSAIAGTFMLNEALKESSPALAQFKLRGRLDINTSGAPSDFRRPVPRDTTRRCVCWSTVRRRAYANLHDVAQAA